MAFYAALTVASRTYYIPHSRTLEQAKHSQLKQPQQQFLDRIAKFAQHARIVEAATSIPVFAGMAHAGAGKTDAPSIQAPREVSTLRHPPSAFTSTNKWRHGLVEEGRAADLVKSSPRTVAAYHIVV
ncbi:hypothetical protein LTR95_003823 [Oleoguttula sp. CCFEE 5521]